MWIPGNFISFQALFMCTTHKGEVDSSVRKAREHPFMVHLREKSKSLNHCTHRPYKRREISLQMDHEGERGSRPLCPFLALKPKDAELSSKDGERIGRWKNKISSKATLIKVLLPC